jgi:hypothetical protein
MARTCLVDDDDVLEQARVHKARAQAHPKLKTKNCKSKL